jgi:hypothetical protein
MSGTVYEAMANVTKAVSSIAKKRSQGVSYEFRGIDEVMNHLHGPLADNGLFLSPRVLDDWQVNMIAGSPDNKGNPRLQAQALFRVCIDVYAADGSMVTLGPGLAQSHDYGDKAAYQAQQNAIKYLLLEAFAIPTAEVDMDARQPDPSPAETVADARRLQNRLKAKAAELAGGDLELAQEFYTSYAPEVFTLENVEISEKAMEAGVKT